MSKNSVPVNKAAWSKKSREGLDYHFHADVYSDIHYTCWHCKGKAVFTALDQKYTYEVRRAHSWQERVLCETCFKTRTNIAAEIISLNDQWRLKKSQLKSNLEFLRRWEYRLKEVAKYRGAPNTAHIAMLEKLIYTATNFKDDKSPT